MVILLQNTIKQRSDNLWNALEKPWQLSLELTWEAFCRGSIPVGAVITREDGEVVAVGRNRVSEKAAPPGQAADTMLAHAELNALLQIKRDDPERHSYILYTSVEPCPLCFGAFYMSGLRDLRYATRDGHAGSTNVCGKTPYLKRKAVRITGPHPKLEPIVLAINVAYFLSNAATHSTDYLLSVWQSDSPEGVELGREVYANGLLQRAADQGWPASKVIEQLYAILQRTR